MLRLPLVVVILAALLSSAAQAATIEGNRAVGCVLREDAAHLLSLSTGDQKRWAEQVGGLSAESRCRAILGGSHVTVLEKREELALISTDGGAQYWLDASVVNEGHASAPSRNQKPMAMHFLFAALAAVGVVSLMVWWFRTSDTKRASAEAAGSSEAGVEVWEEQRLPRSLWGRLVLVAFVLFNAWMAVELLWLLAKLGEVRGQFRDSGFAQLGISLVANARLNEIFMLWAVGAGLLGLAVLGTRGKKRIVRRVG